MGEDKLNSELTCSLCTAYSPVRAHDSFPTHHIASMLIILSSRPYRSPRRRQNSNVLEMLQYTRTTERRRRSSSEHCMRLLPGSRKGEHGWWRAADAREPWQFVKWGTRGAIWFSSRTVQALGAGPMSWGSEMHTYRVSARVGMIRSWGVTGTL